MKAERIIECAREWIDTPFHHQGRKKKVGVDCIGLLVGVATDLGLQSDESRPFSEYDETNYGREPNGQRLQNILDKFLDKKEGDYAAGDILLFKIKEYPQHVGIVGIHPNGKLSIIHAYEQTGKVVEHLINPAWQNRICGVYKFKDNAWQH